MPSASLSSVSTGAEVDDWRSGGFGLYLHWPFCAAKCPYCDFNSHVSASIDQRRWQAAYLSEIDRIGAETNGRVLNTVFFGGGTPSLMDPELVAAILDRVRATWPLSNDLEVTLEANPTSVEAGRFRAYAEAGVNRLSMGVQALNDADLRRLGRMHSVAEARAAFEIARGAFTRVSFDLIYARQDQTMDGWRAELQEALAMAVDHLSLYQLTIEDGTAFGARHAAGGLRGLPDEDLSADLYLATQDILARAGMPAYEVSNHAESGQESRHNLVYWRGGDWIGIGPGAHGRLTLAGQRHATWTELSPAAWLEQASTGNGEAGRELLSATDRAGEYLMMSLRTVEGLDLAQRPIDRLGNGPDQRVGQQGSVSVYVVEVLDRADVDRVSKRALDVDQLGQGLGGFGPGSFGLGRPVEHRHDAIGFHAKADECVYDADKAVHADQVRSADHQHQICCQRGDPRHGVAVFDVERARLELALEVGADVGDHPAVRSVQAVEGSCECSRANGHPILAAPQPEQQVVAAAGNRIGQPPYLRRCHGRRAVPVDQLLDTGNNVGRVVQHRLVGVE